MAVACDKATRTQTAPATDVLDVTAYVGYGFPTQPPCLTRTESFQAAQFGDDILIADRPSPCAAVSNPSQIVWRGHSVNCRLGDHNTQSK